MVNLRSSSLLTNCAAATLLLIGAVSLTAARPSHSDQHSLPASVAETRVDDAIITVNRLGSRNTPVDSHGELLGEVLLYPAGTVKVGLGAAAPTPLRAKHRLKSRPPITPHLASGEIHVELSGGGRIELGARVAGGSSESLTAVGDHLVLLRGGAGVDVGQSTKRK